MLRALITVRATKHLDEPFCKSSTNGYGDRDNASYAEELLEDLQMSMIALRGGASNLSPNVLGNGMPYRNSEGTDTSSQALSWSHCSVEQASAYGEEEKERTRPNE